MYLVLNRIRYRIECALTSPSLNRGRIREAPVQTMCRAREDRTRFFRLITDGNHIVPGLTKEPIECL